MPPSSCLRWLACACLCASWLASAACQTPTSTPNASQPGADATTDATTGGSDSAPDAPEPPAPVTVRVATFNVSFHRGSEGALKDELATPDAAQPRVIAEIIQRARPDVILLNEFDYDAEGVGLQRFHDNYLATPHNGAEAIAYPYRYAVPSNTGVASGQDLDNSGQVDTTPGGRGYGGDAFGFGQFPGQYAFAVLSRYPIDTDRARSFQRFLWRDLPGALLPDDPNTPEPDDWYSAQEREVVRLSSKNHIDLPILIEGHTLHLLASHPTPPVFDGPEDRNGRRNHDEIRLWADYLTPAKAAALRDDAGVSGGLAEDAHFVIVGDMNADPNDGDSTQGAINQLLEHPRVNTRKTPSSQGAPLHGAQVGGVNGQHTSPPEHDTAAFSASSVGNLRLDYALPSNTLEVLDAQVFWPTPDDPLTARLFGTDPRRPLSSDHRLVWIDVKLTSP